jgi:hypothetical protein
VPGRRDVGRDLRPDRLLPGRLPERIAFNLLNISIAF